MCVMCVLFFMNVKTYVREIYSGADGVWVLNVVASMFPFLCVFVVP